MSVTLSVVESTRPGALLTAAGDLGGKVTAMNTAIGTQRNAVQTLKGGWQGQASDAAVAKAEKNIAKQTGFRDRLEQTRQALQNAGARLGSTKSALMNIVASLRGQGWSVSDGGVATAPANLPPALKSTEKAWTAIVQNLLSMYGQVDKEAAGSFPKFGPNVGDGGALNVKGHEKKKSPAETGREDSEALQNGELTPEQRERLNANTHLTPEQRVALGNGTLTLPPDQMSYLQGYSRAFGDKTPAEIEAIMNKVSPPDGDRVADVFQLASNPHIKTGLAQTQPPSIDHPSSGGKYALPDGIHKVLDGPVLTPLVFGEAVRNPDGSIGLPELVGASQPASGMNDLADIIQRGNRDLQVGTDLDSGLFGKSQQLLEQSNGWAVPGADLETDRPRWYHQAVDPTLQNMFNAVNKDDMVIHDALAGSGAHSPNDMTFLSPPGKEFLDNLTEHQWQDDGRAAGGLFDWVGETAAHDSSGRAAETAHALAEYTSDNSSKLLNLPGTDSQSLGQVNPELTRDMARAFSPYFDDMVGSNTGDSNGRFPPLDQDGAKLEPTNTRHLMSVLESDHPPLDEPLDPHGPQTASQIVMDSTQHHIDKYVDIAAHSAIDAKAGEDDFAMKSAGRLQAAMDLGTYDERFDSTHNAFQAEVEAHALKSKAYDAISLGVGELPGPGETVSAVGSFMKDFLVGPEPVEGHVGAPQPRDMFPLQMQMAASLADAGVGDPELRAQVQSFIKDGEFDIPPQTGSADYSDFSKAITNYLETAGQPGAITDMNQTYWNTYSGAMTNPSPPPGQ